MSGSVAAHRGGGQRAKCTGERQRGDSDGYPTDLVLPVGTTAAPMPMRSMPAEPLVGAVTGET